VALDKATGAIAAQDWHFPLFLAHGVTGVRNMNDGTADLTPPPGSLSTPRRL
jgi:hypothetical protein